MKFFSKQVLLSLVTTFASAIAFTPATYAVDGCSSAGFKVATSINLEATFFGMAVGDLNGDGHLDLVAAPNNASSEVMVLLGRGGTERFGPPTSFPTEGLPRKITVGDFNGDSKPDLAVTLDGVGQSGRLSILLNDGTGRFGTPNVISLPGNPYRAVLDDLNNDGKLDIVTGLSTGTTGGKVAVLLGDGAGGFSQAPNSPFFTFSETASLLVIGDFNEDGKRDLAVPNVSGGADILLGDGTGRFAPAVQPPATGGSLTLTAGDFNEDGHLDLLVENRMFLGTGTANFAAPLVVPIPAENSAALAGDVNHDGHLDVVVAGSGGLTIMLGNGTGNLVQGKSYASGFTIFGAGSSFAVLGDFNEDGKVDLAAVQRLGIGILDGDGTGAFNDALSYHTSISSPRYLLAADFNNDGKRDLATVSSAYLGNDPGASRIEVALGDATGGFTKKSVSRFGFSRLSALATADFNNDGKLDLALTRPSDGRVSILLNDGTGGFPDNGSSSQSYLVNSEPSAIKAGDFNNDANADLIVITPTFNSFVVLVGDGSGAFTIMGGAPLQGTSSFTDDLAIADFNADGKSDLAVVRSGANVVHILYGDGSAHFFTSTTLPIPGLPISVAVRDLNGDGRPDIAVTNSVFTQPYVTVLLNNGAQGFSSGTSYPTDGAGILGIGDFNSDSKPDLAVSSGAIYVGSNLDGIAILTNKGNGDFNAPVNFSAGQVSDHLVVSDFNDDGRDDVAISQLFGNSVGLMLNNFTTSQQCLSVNDVTITENDLGTTDAIFTVKLSVPSTETVRVNYFATLALVSPQATKGADFENVSGTLTFLPGNTTQTISVPVKGDVLDEFDQFFSVALTTPINAAISDGRGLGTIIDNDPPPAISINDVVVAEGTQVQSSATFTISLSAPSEKPISVKYELEPGTASATTDYNNVSGTVDFPAGIVSKTISVTIIQDNVFEPDETFFVNLSNATNATITDAQGLGTISNDDPRPTVAISASSFRTEGAAGTTISAGFEVKLSNPSYQAITVSYGTADITATASSDYTATSGTFTFNPGETSSRFITVVVTGDNIDEIDETYAVNLTNPTNATIAVAQGIGTIQDDDGPTISIGNAVVKEGNTGFTNAEFTVTLSFPSVQEITLTYATGGGTATSNVDFQRVVSSRLFIPAGAPTGTITIRVFGDFQIEPDEQFLVIPQTSVNGTVATAQATGTIVNDDSSGKLQFSSQTYNASEDSGSVVISIARVDGATGTVTVDYATSNGTATAGSDYAATSGTLTFNQGEIAKSFSIPIVNDNVLEEDETVNLTLSNPTGGATLGNPTATLTIGILPLFLVLEESGPNPNQVAALDSVLFMRDPFPLLSRMDLLNPGLDRNTRVIVFVTNLQLAGDVASSVRVNLVDSHGRTYDVGTEDVRAVPQFNFIQVTFRLPDNLAPGVCNIKITANNQESNTGTIRVRN